MERTKIATAIVKTRMVITIGGRPLADGFWSDKEASIAAITSFLSRPIDSPSLVSSLSCFVVGPGFCIIRFRYENIRLGRYGLRTPNFSHRN